MMEMMAAWKVAMMVAMMDMMAAWKVVMMVALKVGKKVVKSANNSLKLMFSLSINLPTLILLCMLEFRLLKDKVYMMLALRDLDTNPVHSECMYQISEQALDYTCPARIEYTS
jgi:hypothetical protein